jgi:hypothetical protein
MRKPFKGVGCAFSTGLSDIELVAAIMAWRWSNIPTLSTMWCPCFTHGGFGVCNYLGAEWAEGRPIKIESSMKLCMRGQLRVDS